MDDRLTVLAPELLSSVLSHLSAGDLKAVRCACQHLKAVVDQNINTITKPAIESHRTRIASDFDLLGTLGSVPFAEVFARYLRYYGLLKRSEDQLLRSNTLYRMVRSHVANRHFCSTHTDVQAIPRHLHIQLRSMQWRLEDYFFRAASNVLYCKLDYPELSDDESGGSARRMLSEVCWGQKRQEEERSLAREFADFGLGFVAREMLENGEAALRHVYGSAEAVTLHDHHKLRFTEELGRCHPNTFAKYDWAPEDSLYMCDDFLFLYEHHVEISLMGLGWVKQELGLPELDDDESNLWYRFRTRDVEALVLRKADQAATASDRDYKMSGGIVSTPKLSGIETLAMLENFFLW